jgi:hypothetical protein
LAKLLERVPIPVKESVEEPAATPPAPSARPKRLKTGPSAVAAKAALNLCKMVEKRMFAPLVTCTLNVYILLSIGGLQ